MYIVQFEHDDNVFKPFQCSGKTNNGEFLNHNVTRRVLIKDILSQEGNKGLSILSLIFTNIIELNYKDYKTWNLGNHEQE